MMHVALFRAILMKPRPRGGKQRQ